MNRKILFRGKRINGDGWTCGNYITNLNSHFICCEFSNEIYNVFPNTVGQFIGLLDKNDKQIFEGDIVSMYGRAHEIVWGADGNAPGYIIQGWGCKRKIYGGFETISLRTKQNERLEVIGNVYDNSELLLGEE